MPNLSEMIKRLSPKGWAMVGGSAAVGILFIVLVMHFASAPSYTTLETGVDPSQTDKATSTLAGQGIPYQLQDGGTAIGVESSKVDQARVALAGAGLLDNEQQGFSLLDKQSLGQSNFQQQVTYERALEGQLDTTIESIDGVSSAQVNLALPNSENQLFADQTQPTTASVLLTGTTNLQSGAVRGIAQLVASSVPGLKTSNLTITGDDGAPLWPSSGAASSGLPQEETAEQHYDMTMTDELDAMLTQTLGAGKANVMVNATLNDNRAVQDQLTYGKKGVPLAAQTSKESLKGDGASTGGTAGTSSNIPAYSSSSSGGGNSNYKNASGHTTYGVSKTVTHSVIAPGAIEHQSVAVLISSSVPASSIPGIKQAISNAVGLNPKHGDAISVSQMKFAAPAAAAAKTPAPSPIAKYGKFLKYGILGLGALVFLFFMTRMVRRRERESFGQPTWLSELESPRPLAALEGGQQADVAALQPHVGVARRQVEELVQRDPDRVAQHLRAWMAED